MKNIFKSIAVILFIMSVSYSFTSCGPAQKKEASDTPTSGVIKISADESFEPIIQQEIDVFESLYSKAGIVPEYVSEVDAITLLIRDSVRLAVTTRVLTQQEEETLHAKKLYPKTEKIAIDGIALIVNKENTDTLITVNDIEKILTGKITQWKQLYPKSKLGEIQMVFDNANSSTIRYAIDSICKGQKLSDKLRAQKNNNDVIDYVAQVPNAIGVIGASWIGNRSDTTRLSFSERINVMAVSSDDFANNANSYKPYQAYLAMGLYPFTRNVYIISTDPKTGLPSGFTKFVSTDRGQKIILKSGMVPATQVIRIVNVRDNL